MLSDIVKAVTEVTILTIAIYYVSKFIRGTRGARAVTVFFTILVVISFLAILLHLQVLTWVLSWVVLFSILAVLVLFQPEIRRMITQISSNPVLASAREQRENIEVIIQGARKLAAERFGALIALERGVSLQEVTDSGVVVDCEATPEMFETIFFPNNAIHDGGLLMRGDRILKAACIFPLSQRQDLSHSMGMRHRAGIGLSEETDAVVVIVSEETGYVSYAYQGKLIRNVSDEDLRAFLTMIFVPKVDSKKISGFRRLWVKCIRFWRRNSKNEKTTDGKKS